MHGISSFFNSAGTEPTSCVATISAEQFRTVELVGTITRLHDSKGNSYLVDAAAQVIRRRPHARFVLVGEGPLRADLEAQVPGWGSETGSGSRAFNVTPRPPSPSGGWTHGGPTSPPPFSPASERPALPSPPIISSDLKARPTADHVRLGTLHDTRNSSASRKAVSGVLRFPGIMEAARGNGPRGCDPSSVAGSAACAIGNLSVATSRSSSSPASPVTRLPCRRCEARDQSSAPSPSAPASPPRLPTGRAGRRRCWRRA
jgi:hypothetical protein